MQYWRVKRMRLRLCPEHKNIAIAIAAGQLLLLVAGFLSGWLMAVAAIGAVILLEVLLHRLLRVGSAYRDELALKETERGEAESAFREIRAQRHDFLAHAGALQFMLEEGRGAEAGAYLSKLVGEYDRTNSVIRGEKAHLAALLLHALGKAEQLGVKLTVELTAPLSDLPMSSTDQSKLVSNILSNALEAAEASDSTDSYVKITSLVGGGLYVLEIDNSTKPVPPELADRMFRSYGLSTKGSAHRGIGTFVIASLVESYHGRLEYSAVKDRFSLKIKMPVIK